MVGLPAARAAPPRGTRRCLRAHGLWSPRTTQGWPRAGLSVKGGGGLSSPADTSQESLQAIKAPAGPRASVTAGSRTLSRGHTCVCPGTLLSSCCLKDTREGHRPRRRGGQIGARPTPAAARPPSPWGSLCPGVCSPSPRSPGAQLPMPGRSC